METEQIEYLDSFEENLQVELLKLCTSKGLQSGVFLSSDDIDDKWKEFAPEYMADSIREINAYPTVAVAWAGYVGMAVAEWWDKDWVSGAKALYTSLHGEHGFDDMDEHILVNILNIPLDSKEASDIEATMRSCATLAITLIRREEVEPQSTKAFYIFARTARAMFRIGASLRLHALGYKFEKVQTNELLN